MSLVVPHRRGASQPQPAAAPPPPDPMFMMAAATQMHSEGRLLAQNDAGDPHAKAMDPHYGNMRDLNEGAEQQKLFQDLYPNDPAKVDEMMKIYRGGVDKGMKQEQYRMRNTVPDNVS